ncbi:hypothetical protein [Flavobacterium sp. N1719]|uniref:hypothetical protein n=1 Tax=Flavobacterium sp. N1719 TaxID=2885633 RepID=UPI0022231B05|nr:hypothetical protein [Flavobacterium sp. N1719]
MKNKLLLGFLCLSISGMAQKNLVQNGSFESDFQAWNGNVGALNPYDAKNGKQSCSITQFVGQEWKGIDQTINLPKNCVAIECSGWIKSDGIEPGANSWNTGKMDLEIFNGTASNTFESVASVLHTTPWTLYKKVIALPEKCTKVRLMLALGQVNGTILFDDIKILPLSQEAYNAIVAQENAKRLPEVITDEDATKIIEFKNGDFESGEQPWRGDFIQETNQPKSGKYACRLTSNTPVWTGIDQNAEVPANATQITISAWLKSDSIVQGKNTWNNGLLNVEFTANGTTKTGDDQSVVFVTGTTDWTYYTKTFPLPNGTKNYRIMLALGFATGTLFADDITISFQ